MRRFWLASSTLIAFACGDSGGANDGTGTDSDTDTESTIGTTTFMTEVTSSPTAPTTVTTPGTITSVTVGTFETDTFGTTGPIEPGAYVSAAFGADSNPGTPAEPVRTVQRGIEVAAMSGFTTVFVAAGDYPVASDAGDIVEMVDGIGIQGGFSPDDWGVRNPASFVSRIVDTAVAPAGATAANPHRAVNVGAGLGAETRIDGFTIEASAAANSAGLVVGEGSTPVIVASTLLGGGGSFSTAVYLAAGSPRMFRNTIDGVASADGVPAFAVRGIDCAPNISGNVIRSGDGTNNRTISLTGCGGVFAINAIFGERGLGGGTRAFELVDSTTQIVSNSISVDSENVGFFVLAGGTAAPAVLSSNNFVQVSNTTWCYSHGDQVDVPSLHNNNFGCQNIYAGVAVFNTIPELEMGHPDAADNVDVESGVVDAVSDLHLRDDGTTLCDVARGGVDVGAAGTADIEGAARTDPWSIGAYELDTSCL